MTVRNVKGLTAVVGNNSRARAASQILVEFNLFLLVAIVLDVQDWVAGSWANPIFLRRI